MRRLYGNSQIRKRIKDLAQEIDSAYPKGVLLVGILKGSLFFMADLVRALSVSVEVDFIEVSRFVKGGSVRFLKDLDSDISGRDVVLVGSVVDTGLTLGFLLRELEARRPASLEVCALINKESLRILPVETKFTAFESREEYFLGYGLDYHERYRNLSELFVGDFKELSHDQTIYITEAYK